LCDPQRNKRKNQTAPEKRYLRRHRLIQTEFILPHFARRVFIRKEIIHSPGKGHNGSCELQKFSENFRTSLLKKTRKTPEKHLGESDPTLSGQNLKTKKGGFFHPPCTLSARDRLPRACPCLKLPDLP